MQNQYTSYSQQLHNSVAEKLNQAMDSNVLVALDLGFELRLCYFLQNYKITTAEW